MSTCRSLNCRAGHACRDNVTIFSGQQLVDYCLRSIISTILTNEALKLVKCVVPDALLHCRVVFVAKLKNCRVLSSDRL